MKKRENYANGGTYETSIFVEKDTDNNSNGHFIIRRTFRWTSRSIKIGSISETATSLTGIKYRYGGTTTSGFDCSGYVNYVFKQHDIKLPRTSSGMYNSGTTVKKSDLKTGDLVFFNTSGKGVSHVGIYIGNGEFAHASTSKGVRVDKLNDPYYWGKRYTRSKTHLKCQRSRCS